MSLFGGHLGTLFHCCSFGRVLASRLIRAAHCLTSIQVSTPRALHILVYNPKLCFVVRFFGFLGV